MFPCNTCLACVCAGPWVNWDVNGWNGDYTLDYNFEATFYGVYGSNHPELYDYTTPPVICKREKTLMECYASSNNGGSVPRQPSSVIIFLESVAGVGYLLYLC